NFTGPATLASTNRNTALPPGDPNLEHSIIPSQFFQILHTSNKIPQIFQFSSLPPSLPGAGSGRAANLPPASRVAATATGGGARAPMVGMYQKQLLDAPFALNGHCADQP
uniref:Uncharacterized protein n=1 Tax=Aegilops tauschii subsp. strangulata TaxID=200361 RepID=A0A453FY46_AEGTS